MRRLRDVLDDCICYSNGRVSPGMWARMPWELRDAQRLAEAGLVVAVVSKYRAWARHPLAEVKLFPNLSAALAQYPRSCLMPGKRR